MRDPFDITAGALIYVGGVLLPTVHATLASQHVVNPALERVIVGILAWLAIRVILRNVFPKEAPGPKKYLGVRGWYLAVGAALLYLAWFTNAAVLLAGGVGHLAWYQVSPPVWSTWPQRVAGSVLAGTGFFLIERGITTMKTPEERRMMRDAKRVRRAARKAARAQPIAQPQE